MKMLFVYRAWIHTYKIGTYLDIQITKYVFDSYWLIIVIILDSF